MLCALYGDVERTGYYEKVEHRYRIAAVLVFLGKQSAQSETLLEFSKTDGFLSFADGLIGHSIHALTDSMQSLSDIHELQQILAAGGLDEGDTDAKRKELAQLEGAARSGLMLTNQTLELLATLSVDLAAQLTRDELRVRALMQLTVWKLIPASGSPGGHGSAYVAHPFRPQCLQLEGKQQYPLVFVGFTDMQVSNPEQLGFRPRELVTVVAACTLQLARGNDFAKAIVKSGFYSAEMWNRGLRLLRKFALLPEDKIAQFETFIGELDRHHQEALSAAIDVTEVPDEYLDPLMATIMEDPVELPTSKYIVDRYAGSPHDDNADI